MNQLINNQHFKPGKSQLHATTSILIMVHMKAINRSKMANKKWFKVKTDQNIFKIKISCKDTLRKSNKKIKAFDNETDIKW